MPTSATTHSPLSEEELRAAITRIRRERDAHQMDEPDYVNAILTLITAQKEAWWICNDSLANGGKKILGPFVSRELAMTVRELLENRDKPVTYWIENELKKGGE